MRDSFFYSMVAGLMCGIGVGTTVLPSLVVVYWVLVVAGGVLLLARRGGNAPTPRELVVPLFLIFVAFGVARTMLVTPVTTPVLNAQVGGAVEWVGTVTRDPEVRERSTHLYVTADGTTVLVYADRNVDVAYGDMVTVSGTLRTPESFTTNLGRTFNYPGYLRARGVGYTISFATVAVTAEDAGNPVVASVLRWKHRFMDRIESLIPEPAAGLGEGLLLGVSSALGDRYEDIFRTTGITHIVVLSGYNVMLVVAFFMSVLAYVLPYRSRLLVGMVGIAGFALMVGLSATVLRASIMAALILVVRFHGMTHHVLRALALAGVVMLLINPYLLLFDVGFQLSFLATLALIVVAPVVETWFHRVPSVFGVREFLVATVTTQLCVTPLILYQIGQVSLVAIVVNVLVLPAVPVAMLLTFAAGMVSYVSLSLASLVGYGAYLVLSYILTVATLFAQVPLAAVVVPPFPVWVMALAYLCLGGLWYVLTHRGQSSVPNERDLGINVSGWTIETETAGELRSPAPAAVPAFFR